MIEWQKLGAALKWVKDQLPIWITRWGIAVVVVVGIVLLCEIIFGNKTLAIGPQISLSDQGIEGRAVPVGGIVMWWGNWEDSNIRPPNYELCDGTKVNTAGPLKDVLKPNFLKAFPRGLASGSTNAREQSHYVESKETISLKHHHRILGPQALSSDNLWVPFGRYSAGIDWGRRALRQRYGCVRQGYGERAHYHSG